MYLEQHIGPVPGLVNATVRHGQTTRVFTIETRKTNLGRFIARMPDHRWSTECETLEDALMLHAKVLFPMEYKEEAPWFSHPHPAPRPAQYLHEQYLTPKMPSFKFRSLSDHIKIPV